MRTPYVAGAAAWPQPWQPRLRRSCAGAAGERPGHRVRRAVWAATAAPGLFVFGSIALATWANYESYWSFAALAPLEVVFVVLIAALWQRAAPSRGQAPQPSRDRSGSQLGSRTGYASKIHSAEHPKGTLAETRNPERTLSAAAVWRGPRLWRRRSSPTSAWWTIRTRARIGPGRRLHVGEAHSGRSAPEQELGPPGVVMLGLATKPTSLPWIPPIGCELGGLCRVSLAGVCT